jgi:hypothetical protein
MPVTTGAPSETAVVSLVSRQRSTRTSSGAPQELRTDWQVENRRFVDAEGSATTPSPGTQHDRQPEAERGER